MQKLVWQNSNGDVINLTSGNYGITEWEGFANTSLNIQSQQVPFQDGRVFLDALMEQRELSVTLAMNDGGNLETRYRLRRELIHALNPKLGEGYLIYTNDFISKRIKCVAQIPLFETHNSNDSGTPKASLAWTACEPYWEDLEETITNIHIGETAVIDNQGDIPTNIKARFFTQNAVNPTLKNMTTNKKIEFHNTLLKTLNINTNMGNKTVYTENINLKSIGAYGNFTNVCFGKRKSLWVATTRNGDIFYSHNGNDWNICEFETNIIANFQDVVYAENLDLFVAVGGSVSGATRNCSIATSSDGITWVNRGISGISFTSVVYSESLNLFIAGGSHYNDTSLMKSSDGITWEYASGTIETIEDMIYVDTLNCFYGISTGAIIKSSDGITWESSGNGGYGITYSKRRGLFVIVSHRLVDNVTHPVIKTSSDGVNWTENILSNIDNVQTIDVSYSEVLDLFIATGSYNTILSSQNGTTWDIIQIGENANIRLNASLYSKEQGKYLILGSNSLIYSSIDGLNWDIIQNFRGTLNDVVYSKKLDMFIAVGNNGLILASKDRVSWKNKNSNITSNLYAITYSESLEIFIAVGTYNKILKSVNGDDWEEVFTVASEYYELRDVTYSEKLHLFVACGFITLGSGDIMTSTDGVHWSYRTVSYLKRCFCITYFEEKNLFIIGTATREIAISSNGINWTIVSVTPIDSYQQISNISYSKENEYFFILSRNTSNQEIICKSLDGINWTSETLDMDFDTVNCVIYSESNKMYFVLCSGGEVYTSINLNDWDKIKDTAAVLNSATISAKDNNNIVFVGNNGIVMLSYFSSEENQIQYISTDSDMNFNLKNGKNEIILSCASGDFSCSITYRQKYIGV